MQNKAESAAPGTWMAPAPHRWSRGQSIAGIAAIVALVLAGLWTLHAFLPALGWGSIFAISLWPTYQRCARRWPAGQALLLPACFTLFILMVFVIPLVMVVAAVAHDSAGVAQWLASARAQGVPAPALLHHLPYGDPLSAWWQSALSTPEGINRLSHAVPGFPVGTGERVLGGLVHRLLLLGFMLLALFFLLRDGRSVARAMDIASQRAFGEAGGRVARQAVQAIRGTVNGLVIVGFGEGLILGVAYGLAGAGHAALLGLLTGLLSAIPFGALMAVALAAGMLAANGQIVAAAAVATLGVAVVFVADHFVRPVFIGEATRLPFLWVLLGILGGIEAWGLIGLVVGPAVVAVAMLLWREWVGAQEGPLNPTAEDVIGADAA